MKKIYKKTTAMLLSGTVMLGGFIASGLNANACTLTVGQERDIQRVKCCCKGYGDVYVMENKKQLDESVKGCNRKTIANNGHVIDVKNPSEIPTQIRSAQRYKKTLVEVHYHDFYYLIVC